MRNLNIYSFKNNKNFFFSNLIIIKNIMVLAIAISSIHCSTEASESKDKPCSVECSINVEIKKLDEMEFDSPTKEVPAKKPPVKEDTESDTEPISEVSSEQIPSDLEDKNQDKILTEDSKSVENKVNEYICCEEYKKEVEMRNQQKEPCSNSQESDSAKKSENHIAHDFSLPGKFFYEKKSYEVKEIMVEKDPLSLKRESNNIGGGSSNAQNKYIEKFFKISKHGINLIVSGSNNRIIFHEIPESFDLNEDYMENPQKA